VLQVGKRLGDFEVIRLLGKGGMGEVYEARQLNPARTVALKILAPWLSSNEEALERFWREAEVPAQLDHPGIVRIISTGKTDDGTAYYAMHLVRGVSLAALIRKSTETLASTAALLTTPPADTPSSGQNGLHSPGFAVECPVGEPPPGVLEAYRADRFNFVARIGAKAARALADAHRRGYLHRDIKPSNLMIDHHDQLYLVDFGLTKALDPGAAGTQLGVVRGTPWYMSPEQARGEAIDQRSDIYSLGVTLYELATEGKGPFTANRDNTSAVITQVKAGLRCPLRDLAPEIPHRLEKIILKAMHFKPRRRFESVEEMAAALEAFSGTGASAASRSRTPFRTPGKSRWKVFAGTAGLLVLLGVAAIAYFNFDRDKHEVDKAALINEPQRPDYPEMLLKRKFDTEIPLLTKSSEPVWAYQLEGKGLCLKEYGTKTDALLLESPATSLRTLIALDDDPLQRWFEFSVEMAQFTDPKSAQLTDGRTPLMGVFFGWKKAPKADADRPPFFILELNEKPIIGNGQNHPNGLTRLGTSVNTPQRGDLYGRFEHLRPVPPGRAGHFPLSQSGPGLVWHKVRIKALGDILTVKVDELAPKTYKLSELKQADPALGELDPRGALGIWAKDGYGKFRNATITALEPP
jgi:serine/threonine protein kinase